MAKKKIVYLDTQDYISTFNATENSRHLQTLSQLIELRDSGLAVFGYSAIVLIEFITKPASGYNEERVDRGRHIKNICGNNSFPYPSDLRSGAKFPNDGLWIGRKERSLISLKPLLKSAERAARKKIRTIKNIPRAERRKLAATLTLRDLLKNQPLEYGKNRSDFEKLPVPTEFIDENYLERTIKGEMSIATAEKKLTQWASDPEYFSRIIYEYAGEENVVEKYFSQSIDQMEKATDQMVEAIDAMKHINEKVDEYNKAKKDLKRDFSDLGAAETFDLIRMKRIKMPPLPFDAIEERLASAFGEKRVRHFKVYLEYITKNPAQFSRSDFFDLWQMIYAYDADLFRCDKKMGHIFKNFKPFKRKLVTDFHELPKLITQ